MERRSFTKGLAAIPLMLAPILAPILASAVGRSAQAQASWAPDRPIRIVVPFAAGGSTDVTARLMGNALGERLGQTVVVDNRGGAAGNIGAEYVARAEPDGYTLIMATSSTHATNAALYRRLAFNPVRDFTPISQIAFVPNLLVVNPEVPVNSIAELVAYAKARPGQLNYGSGGAGSSLHLAAAVFAYRAGIDMVHVPYRGGAPVAADLVSGKLQVSFSPLVEVLQQVRAGKLRALGVTTARRSALLPDIPAISEVIPGYEVALWNGIMGPAGLPAPVAARLASEMVAIVGSQEMRSRLGEQGSDPVGSTPQEFAAFVAAEQPKWAELVRISGATVD
ncbi:MAG: tripartite tricarboxylate transporter substrate binding protein [Rhodospirillales bacterium]|nr:tripartite tricarboxylate transporter substrate binding protein [Rhodospirillales bacterium]